MSSRNLKIAAPINGAPPDAQIDGVNAAVLDGTAAQRSGAKELLAAHTRLGEILVEAGLLGAQQVQAVLAQQADNPRRFGELAVGLGLVAQSDIDLALSKQLDIDFEPSAPGQPGLPVLNVGTLQSRQQEALRSVRSQLLLRWFGEAVEQHTMAVVSHGAGDGRSHVCAHLGRLFAQSQEDTLLIDTHFGQPRLHEYFGLNNQSGLVSYLSRQTPRAPIRAVAGHPNLHVLTTGPASSDDLALLERPMFARLLSMLARRYAVILLDTPAAGLRSEAVTVAVRSSGCLLVMRRNRSRMADVQRLKQRLTQHGVEVLGAVVNDH
jgi:protein-tyrosine kinase